MYLKPDLNKDSCLTEEDLEVLQKLKKLGAKKIEISYQGGGDEGQMHDINCSDLEAETLSFYKEYFTDLGYQILESKHPGWELNEGSEGDIEIDLSKERPKVKISHGTYHLSFTEEEETL